MNDNFDYIKEANVTLSNEFHPDVPAKLIGVGLLEIKDSTNPLDVIKKYMFYGREDEKLRNIRSQIVSNLKPFSNPIDFTVLMPLKNPETSIKIFHGIIGIITEAGELAEALGQAILGGEAIDLVNVEEELGDIQWYMAAILGVTGSSFDTIQRRNIKKLRARFPNGFTEFDANNRNLEVEREILENQ